MGGSASKGISVVFEIGLPNAGSDTRPAVGVGLISVTAPGLHPENRQTKIQPANNRCMAIKPRLDPAALLHDGADFFFEFVGFFFEGR